MYVHQYFRSDIMSDNGVCVVKAFLLKITYIKTLWSLAHLMRNILYIQYIVTVNSRMGTRENTKEGKT
jgi:hypothetical protein